MGSCQNGNSWWANFESHMHLSFGKRWWVDEPLPGLEAMIALITFRNERHVSSLINERVPPVLETPPITVAKQFFVGFSLLCFQKGFSYWFILVIFIQR